MCLLAIGSRNNAARKSLHQNLIQPFVSESDTISDQNYASEHPPLQQSGSKFKNFKVSEWQKQEFALPDPEDSSIYFRRVPSGAQECFVGGTDWDLTRGDKCVCRNDYYGKDCGIPDSVWFGHFKDHPREKKALVRRPKLRRLIQGVLVNHEFDFFETRIATLSNVTDVFIVQESNFTTFGTSKDLHFLEKFRKGWLSEVHPKLLYIYLSTFSQSQKISGWMADGLIRKHLSVEGLSMIRKEKDDDLFLLLDSDELPLPEPLLFLKLYDGYGEPVRWGFRWTVFGFYWLKAEDPGELEKLPLIGAFFRKKERPERLLQLWVTCTLGMLKTVYHNNAMFMRRNVWKEKLLAKEVSIYQNSTGVRIRPWEVGRSGHFAGYHCSWCYNPEGIRTKLESAQADDKPRWGDYPEKTNLTYIANLIKTGGWFDDSHPFIFNGDTSDKFYAPQYMMQNFDRFRYLLEPPKREP